ncbi:MAG: TIGR03000 domain-containing protein [Bacteroidales bacterium]|nr:TIGR03000 domain-containing protein [Bacteroidales bacterium]
MYSFLMLAAVSAGPDTSCSAMGDWVKACPLFYRCRCRPLVGCGLMARVRMRRCGPCVPSGCVPCDSAPVGIPGPVDYGLPPNHIQTYFPPPLPAGYTAPAGWILVPAPSAGMPYGMPISPPTTVTALPPQTGLSTPTAPPNPMPSSVPAIHTPALPMPRPTMPAIPVPTPPGTAANTFMAPRLFTPRNRAITPAVAEVAAPDATPAPAQMTFHVPPGTTITVDGYPVPGDGPIRLFHTPTLQPGERYFYEFQAERLVNGKTVRVVKRVELRAGDAISETFPQLEVEPIAFTR